MAFDFATSNSRQTILPIISVADSARFHNDSCCRSLSRDQRYKDAIAPPRLGSSAVADIPYSSRPTDLDFLQPVLVHLPCFCRRITPLVCRALAAPASQDQLGRHLLRRARGRRRRLRYRLNPYVLTSALVTQRTTITSPSRLAVKLTSANRGRHDRHHASIPAWIVLTRCKDGQSLCDQWSY